MKYRKDWLVTILFLLVATIGCGTNPSELLFQTVDSAGRVAFDLWLTQFANDLADAFDQDMQDEDPQATDDDDTGEDPNDEPTDGGTTEPGVGDVAAGLANYAAQGCGGCHCDDATGGCALDAPPVVGALLEDLTDHLTGDGPHPTKPTLSAQDLLDMEAYLASLQ